MGTPSTLGAWGMIFWLNDERTRRWWQMAKGWTSYRLPLVHYRGNCRNIMTIAHSKLTAQGQISVPAEVRRKLGIGPGSILEWNEDGENIVIRRAGRYTSEEVHRALFPKPPPPRTLEEMKAGVRRYVKKRYARR